MVYRECNIVGKDNNKSWMLFVGSKHISFFPSD